MDHTTPYHRNGTLLVPVVTFTVLLGVGTGGDYTPGYHAVRAERIAFHRNNEPSGQPSTVAADIEYVRSVLNLTMTQLAQCLRVSRQALYNWMGGGQIKDDNATKLNELKFAANVIAAENMSDRFLMLRRKLPGGKTLIETISAGAAGGRCCLWPH
jgi:DNA-binding transcriptional regulator YiaG